MTQRFNEGLYDERFEKGSCGMGFVAHMHGEKTHKIVEQGLEMLVNLSHRGATGCDPYTGDGAGLLVQIPHEFFQKECEKIGMKLPVPQDYAVGMIFLPRESDQLLRCEGILEAVILGEKLELLGWRDVPVYHNCIGEIAKGTEPLIKQVFIARGVYDLEAFEIKLYKVRKQVEQIVRSSAMHNRGYFYIPSLSTQTIVYKGLLLAAQIGVFYKDLQDPLFKSALALIHQRYSTNTFPTWDLAQPFRYIAHNGEINTIQGNRNWMNAREGILQSSVLGTDIEKLFPLLAPKGSDSATFDNAFELLVRSGRSLTYAMTMLIPEAWQNDLQMPKAKRAFYNYHATMLEPWDGPAAIAFTNGKQIGATLDRNGLRPARYAVTEEGIVVLASEAGVLKLEEEQIIQKGRIEPGKMFLIDLEAGRIVPDQELKAKLYQQMDYSAWIERNQLTLEQLEAPSYVPSSNLTKILERQQMFGYSFEELKMILAPMAQTGKEPIGSMGNDTPLAVLSQKPQLLYHYFKQLFAQVTNPPIDPIREEVVMSLVSFMGQKTNLLDTSMKESKFLQLKYPILSNKDLAKISPINTSDLRAIRLPMLFKVSEKGNDLEEALELLCERAKEAIQSGHNIIILSDREMNRYDIPIPALLATSALQQYLIRERLRTHVNIIVETGEAREVMHFALLIGYGATAINPYLAFESIEELIREGLYLERMDKAKAEENYIHAICTGLLKIISKMGISTIQSYRSAQIFEAIGLSKALVEKYFTGTASRIGGINLEGIAQETLMRHREAYEKLRKPIDGLGQGGQYHYRPDGEYHHFNPYTISKLQQATRSGKYETFKEFSQAINEQSKALCTLRGLLSFKDQKPIPIEQVEPASSIVKRFATGAMSFGSISKEAHETLAIAMNQLGGRSNTGEGGEDEERFGDERRSRIKQIASGRFGVTTQYLVNADELQIKMAQGAKPGEGGQLPGGKVNEIIGKVRHATPGIDLISPPPHHDIYSIEDLAQLIYDLKNVNSKARVSVKLVSEVGVGTVAAGVAKAKADVILISGHDGGTGASPLTSIKHAGVPWELGLAEAQQVLILNNLRGRIILQTDGQLKTGRDVVIATLLGAEEFGFATAPLVVSGCMMMRKCHLNTCPVGIATQDPELRKQFKGKPEELIKYFFFVAEEVRELMAQLGFHTIEEMVGKVEVLQVDEALKHWKSQGVDLTAILYKAKLPTRIAVRHIEDQKHELDNILDQILIKKAHKGLSQGEKVRGCFEIQNTYRTVGAMLSGDLMKRYGEQGLEEDTLYYTFKGSAGQSFGAFLTKGVTLELQGEANDYVGKGLSGGKIVIRPHDKSPLQPEAHIIAGNTLLYGATSGEVFISGKVGERFGVRNSGAIAVVEGVGDHGCEYMTGGSVVILGSIGRNFAAGMSGGIAYVYGEISQLQAHINPEFIEIESISETHDSETVKQLIQKHFKYTNSPKAAELLESWEKSSQSIYRIIPTAYKTIINQHQTQHIVG